MKHKNIIEAIGNTPIVRLNKVTEGLPAEVYAKLEFTNPGGSVKDRIGWWLLEDAEKRGRIKPGGTIVEGTSGNTGFGLAIAAAIKGYKCIFVLPDKMSEEKIRNLRAFGAKVIVTPTAVEPEDPRSYYSVSRRLATETPNSIYIDQYNNPANPECHYNTTGPEILKQFPDIDVFVSGIGTGGTVCGVGRYLKEKKPDVKVVAVDAVGSIVYEYFKTGVIKTAPKTYKIEGIGEDFIPANYNFDYVDDMLQVGDKESFLMTRDLLKREGIFSGISSGSAVVGAIHWIRAQGDAMKGKKVLVMLPDSGNRYLSKVFDDDWMTEVGFIEKQSLGSVQDLLNFLQVKPDSVILAKQSEKIKDVIQRMQSKGISQLPVSDNSGWIKGVVTESTVLSSLYRGLLKPEDSVEKAIESKIEFVSPEESIEKVSTLVTEGKFPLVTRQGKEATELLAVIAKIDVLAFLGSRNHD